MARFIPKNDAFYLSLFCVKYRVLQSVIRLCTILYRGADKSLARRTSRFISFDTSLVLYIYIRVHTYSSNISLIMIINR